MKSKPYNPQNLTADKIPTGWRLLTQKEVAAFQNKFVACDYAIKYFCVSSEWKRLYMSSSILFDELSYIREIPKAEKKQDVVVLEQKDLITLARQLVVCNGSPLGNKILIMTAAQLGAQIQFKLPQESEDSFVSILHPAWNFENFVYRVVPIKPKTSLTTIEYTGRDGTKEFVTIEHFGELTINKQ